MRVREMNSESRPRERMQRFGAGVVSDAELLAIVLQKGSEAENVLELSHHLLAKGGLSGLATLSLQELQQVRGIGPAKAMQILALFELGKRVRISRKDGYKISCARDVYRYASSRLMYADKEQFMVLHLDTKSRIIKDEVVAIGILDAAVTHPREVFKNAIKESAGSIIVVHNHPSGDPAPSEPDIIITKRLMDAGKIVGIPVVDHVIIGSGCFWSYKDSLGANIDDDIYLH